MLSRLAQKLFGSKNDRELKRMQPLVDEINQFEAELQKLSLEELRAKTDAFRSRIQEATQATRSQLREVTQQARETEDREGREGFLEEAEQLEKELHAAEADVLDEILPHAYAAVREVSRRVTGMRHFDSQLVGGIDAWIEKARRDPQDGKVGLVGYEINFNRYFYEYRPPRPLEEIEADIRQVEEEIVAMLQEMAG